MLRQLIRWIATSLVSLGMIVAVEPFVHVNVEHLAKQRHWDEFLAKWWSEVPDLSPLLEARGFWFCFGTSLGVALALWIVRLFPERRSGSNVTAPAAAVLPLGAQIASTPEVSATSSAMPTSLALRRHYGEDDGKRQSAALYDLYKLLNDRISPTQLAVHEALRGLPYRIKAEGSESTKKKLSELRTVFSTIRDYLIDHFMQGNHYYADEIQDITNDKDLLNAEIVALDNYVAVVDTIAAATPENLRLLEPYQAVLRDANFDLGSWVSRCNERIKAKRNALQ